jgi:hypothetical protein
MRCVTYILGQNTSSQLVNFTQNDPDINADKFLAATVIQNTSQMQFATFFYTRQKLPS